MTTMFETWHVPTLDCELEEESFAWSTEGKDVGPKGPEFWRANGQNGLIGEIKPHTVRGIPSGWAQLRKRLLEDLRLRSPGAKTLSTADLQRGVLVTYMKDSPDSVLVRAAFASDPKTWIRLGRWRFAWARPVPLETCLACVGSRVEGLVRDIVRQRTSLKLDPKRNAQRHGADLIMSLELSEFLAELNAELQAELAEQLHLTSAKMHS